LPGIGFATPPHDSCTTLEASSLFRRFWSLCGCRCTEGRVVLTLNFDPFQLPWFLRTGLGRFQSGFFYWFPSSLFFFTDPLCKLRRDNLVWLLCEVFFFLIFALPRLCFVFSPACDRSKTFFFSHVGAFHSVGQFPFSCFFWSKNCFCNGFQICLGIVFLGDCWLTFLLFFFPRVTCNSVWFFFCPPLLRREGGSFRPLVAFAANSCSTCCFCSLG